jgi:hypothetical protein
VLLYRTTNNPNPNAFYNQPIKSISSFCCEVALKMSFHKTTYDHELDALSAQTNAVLYFKKYPGIETIINWFRKNDFKMDDLNYIKSRRNETAMHAACRQGNLRIVRFLLKEGAIWDVEDCDGNR